MEKLNFAAGTCHGHAVRTSARTSTHQRTWRRKTSRGTANDLATPRPKLQRFNASTGTDYSPKPRLSPPALPSLSLPGLPPP